MSARNQTASVGTERAPRPRRKSAVSAIQEATDVELSLRDIETRRTKMRDTFDAKMRALDEERMELVSAASPGAVEILRVGKIISARDEQLKSAEP